jgi:hypothetical protein
MAQAATATDPTFDRLYMRLIELTSYPGPKTLARLIEENDILEKLHSHSRHFQTPRQLDS